MTEVQKIFKIQVIKSKQYLKLNVEIKKMDM